VASLTSTHTHDTVAERLGYVAGNIGRAGTRATSFSLVAFHNTSEPSEKPNAAVRPCGAGAMAEPEAIVAALRGG